MKLISILCWVVAAVAILGIAIWFLSGFVFKGGISKVITDLPASIGLEALTGSFDTVGTYSVPTDEIDSIGIEWVAGSVDVKPYDGDVIKITEYAQRELRDGEQLRMETSGGKLKIAFCENKTLKRFPPKNLEALVPRQLSESLKELAVESVSGSIDIETIGAESLKTTAVSGSVKLYNIAGRNLDAETTSGSLTISHANAETMKIGSVSGSINASEIEAKTLRSGTTSGSMDLQGTFGAATLGSVSGGITLKCATVPATLKAETTSGSITIAVPNGDPISVSHTSISGKLTSDIPITMNAKDPRFILSSVSGSVRIMAY